jgi:hypothetical protein
MECVSLPRGAKIVKKAELEDDWGGLMKKKSKSKGGAGPTPAAPKSVTLKHSPMDMTFTRLHWRLEAARKLTIAAAAASAAASASAAAGATAGYGGLLDARNVRAQRTAAAAAAAAAEHAAQHIRCCVGFWASIADYEAVPPLDPLALCVAQAPVYSETSDATIPMPSDAAGWAVAEMKRLLTSRRMRERDAVQAACRRASAMKMAAGALASLASSSDGMPASLVKYVAELTTTDVPIDSGIISRCRTWLATNKHEMMKCKTPLAMIASAAPIVDATINNKAKALDPTLTDACHAALQLMKVAKATAVAARKEAAAVAGARAKARAAAWAAGVAAEARAEAWAAAWAEGVFCEALEPRKAAVARGRVRESRRRFRAAARGAGWESTKEHGRNRVAARCAPSRPRAEGLWYVNEWRGRLRRWGRWERR